MSQKDEIESLAEKFDAASPQNVLKWAFQTFHPKIALASSFGLEDVALIDLMVKINPQARVFTLDTGRLHQETYNIMDRIRDRYGIRVEVYFPDAASVEKMVNEHGLNLFYKSIDLRKTCCGIRKVEPLKRALSGLDAWITGLRRDQAVTRASVRKIELDTEHGNIVKINPITDWTLDDVWSYIRVNDVPYNVLHDRGFPSIGCEPCTRAVKPGEDPRAGRWWWELPEQKECGLHVKTKK